MPNFSMNAKQVAAVRCFIDNCSATQTATFSNPTACTSCWGGTCANGFTG